MELIILFLIVLVSMLFYKVSLLNKHLVVLTFLEKNVDKLLIKKEIIKISDIDTVVNESIGNMTDVDGDRMIKFAKKVGIQIPEYMNEEDLKKYIKKQETKRNDAEIFFTDRMIMEENNSKLNER